MGNVNEPVISIKNGAGDIIAFHKHNTYKAHCVECQVVINAGRGVQRKMHNHPGSGYLCHVCAGNTIKSHNLYMFNRFSAILSPFDGVYSCYAIPAAELAQAWHDHGAAGLRIASENLREQARAEFLTRRNVPFTPEKISVTLNQVPA
jgi:hypothetical protein